MIKPSNPIRRHIVNRILNWHPTQQWTNNPMQDAKVLTEECHKILPYFLVVSMYYPASDLTTREKDPNFVECLRNSFPIFTHNLKNWILSSPECNTALELPSGSSKIRYGYFAGSARIPKVTDYFELQFLRDRYPTWLGLKNRHPSLTDIASFIHLWGNPLNSICQKGRSKDERYIFVSPSNG